MAFPIAAALSAGGSLISGIMDRRQAEKQNKQQTRAIQRANERAENREDNRIQRLVKDANKAGIHPLAALGSPSVGTFATPQAAFGGAPISGSAVGDAISSFGAAMPQEGSSAGLQKELLKAQIRNVNASTAQLLADATSRSRIATSRSPADLTSVKAFGLQAEPHSGFSDVGGAGQQRYGEPYEWAMFLPTLMADINNSMGTSFRDKVSNWRDEVQKQMRARGVTPR